VLSKFLDATGPGMNGSVGMEDMSDRAFKERHKELEADEAQIREEERRDSIVRWAICDAPGCRKWRMLSKGSPLPPGHAEWYCGGLTSLSGSGKPSPKHCAKGDDWIRKCVGERLAAELEAAGIRTVAQLEMRDKNKPPPHYETYCERMRKLGVYFDQQSQTICKY